MITEKHNDGMCFKLTIIYIDHEELESFEPYIRYSEDDDELFEHMVDKMNELRGRGMFIQDIRIQDDSK